MNSSKQLTSARLTCHEVYGLLIPRTSFKTAKTGASDIKSSILLWGGAEIVVLDKVTGSVRQKIGHFTVGRCRNSDSWTRKTGAWCISRTAGNSRTRWEPYGWAHRSARAVIAGGRIFRRWCRLHMQAEYQVYWHHKAHTSSILCISWIEFVGQERFSCHEVHASGGLFIS